MSTGNIKLRNEIEISFARSVPNFGVLLAAVRELPQRRWTGETWNLPISPLHAAAAVAFAQAHDFELDPKIVEFAGNRGGTDFSFRPSVPVGRIVRVDNDEVVVKFPFSAELTEQIKRIPGRDWKGKNDKNRKEEWAVPFTHDALVMMVKFLELNDFTGEIERVKELAGKVTEIHADAIEASKAATADFEVEGLGGVLRPFQKAGVKYAVEKKRLIIGDEMGLGKTVEALATVHHLGAYPCLVICPASLKLNWYKETRKWLPEKYVRILGDTARPDAAVTIVHYDKLKQYRDYLVHEELKSIICDESHLLKNAKAQRTVFTEEIINGVVYDRSEKLDRRKKDRFRAPVDVRLLLTGTPVLNRPSELTSQLQLIDRLKEFGGWWGFVNEFCDAQGGRFGMDTSGHGNMKLLNDRLRACCYVRRTKAEVLKELPPKQRTIVPTDLSNRQEYIKAEADLIGWLKSTAGSEKADAAARAEQLVRIEALKKLAAYGKMDAIKEWVQDFLDTGEKLVMFGWHREIVDDLGREFKCNTIHGGVPPDRRQPIVDAFQNDPKVKAIAMNVQSGGVGLTLTAASNVIFCELGWNPATMDQAGDRCHRIGQTDSVTEWWFIGTGTIDEDIQQLIESKRSVVDAATDGVESVQDVKILSELVARLRNDERAGAEHERSPLRKGRGTDVLELF